MIIGADLSRLNSLDSKLDDLTFFQSVLVGSSLMFIPGGGVNCSLLLISSRGLAFIEVELPNSIIFSVFIVVSTFPPSLQA